MKVNEIMDEGYFEGDPTIIHAPTTYNLGSRAPVANWAVFAGKRLLAKGKTKQEAADMVNSQTMIKKFGKLTAQQMK